MSVSQTDQRTPISKAEFVQIYRWHRQLRLDSLAIQTGIQMTKLAQLENEQGNLDGRASGRLADSLGLTMELWERIGVEPGYPGSEPRPSKNAAKGQDTFVEQINRIAALPDSWRVRQMQVIRKELTYLDA